MLPRIATPRAPPICLVVSFMAEPTPALANGRDPMIESVAGAIAVPMPAPRMARAKATRPYPVSMVIVARMERATATMVRPEATTTLLPSRSVRRADNGAATIMVATGITRSPASSGV